MTSAEKSIIPEFLIVAERNGTIKDFQVTATRITNKRTGSFIIFSGIKTSSGDQTANLKSIAGITTWVIDEGEDFKDEKVFDDIDNSVRSINAQNRVIWIQNPSTKEHFIYKRWIEENSRQIDVKGYKVSVSDLSEVEHIHTTYHIALKYLSQSFIDKAEKLEQKDVKKYYHTYIGGWLEKSEGVIYENWEEGEFDESLPYCYGLDFGFNDPNALVKVAVNHNEKKIYLDECYFKSGDGLEQLYNALENIVGKQDLIVGDNASRTLIYSLYDKGLNIVSCRDKKPKIHILIIQGYTLVVTKDSHNLKKALNNYAWHDSRSGIPKHDWSDLCDAFRYGVMELIDYH
jgi:phage terminase large subunit